MASEVGNEFLESLKASTAPQLAVPTIYSSQDVQGGSQHLNDDNPEHAIAAFHHLAASLGEQQQMRIDDEKSVSSDSEGPGDGKKGKVKKQEKQKKIVVNFVEALTCATEETLQPEPVKCNDQNMPPLDKQKLVDLFEQHVNTKDISTSVFWKYTKREVYVDRNIYRNRKTGGYKGFSGVQWRNPDRPEDLAIIEPRLHRIRRYLTRGKDALIQSLREVYNGEDAIKGVKIRRKKLPNTPIKSPGMMGLGEHGVHEDVAGAHMLVQAAAMGGQIPGLGIDPHTSLSPSEVVAVVVAAAAQQQQQQQRERELREQQQQRRNSGDEEDDEEEDDLACPPPAKKMKLNDHSSSSDNLTTTTTRTTLSSASLSSGSSLKSSSSQQYQHSALHEQQQLVLDTLNNSIGHLQLVYQSLSTHTAIEMLKLLNDPEVLTALQNLKAFAPIINQQLGGHADIVSQMQSGQDQTHG